jgi:hypothetical protein
MCQFYPSRDLLLDGLISYFRTGVERRERGIWVAAPPLPTSEIVEAVAEDKVLKRAVASGQLKIVDAIDWHGDPATLNAEETVLRWFDEEERAIADGYEALRIAGNTAFFPRSAWPRLMAYEAMLHERIKDRRIVACCSYHRDDARPVDILEIVRRHDGAMEHGGKHWEVHLHSAGEFVRGRPGNSRPK